MGDFFFVIMLEDATASSILILRGTLPNATFQNFLPVRSCSSSVHYSFPRTTLEMYRDIRPTPLLSGMPCVCENVRA